MYWYPRYVPVGLRRARALVKMRELREQGMKVQPVELRGRTIAGSFWGRRWCEHLESFSDYANRLPLGRTYLRNGSVCHLAIGAGRVEAMVAGQDIYRVVVRIRRLDRPSWEAIRTACAGRIGSVIDLLQGRLPDRVMDVFTHRDTGLFPKPGEIEMTCDCPDGAAACRHAAAVIYGVGSRLDDSPELLFHLRGVDEAELITADTVPPRGTAAADDSAGGDPGGGFEADPAAAGGAPAPPRRRPGAVAVAARQPSARRPAAAAVPQAAARLAVAGTAAGSKPPRRPPAASTGTRLQPVAPQPAARTEAGPQPPSRQRGARTVAGPQPSVRPPAASTEAGPRPLARPPVARTVAELQPSARPPAASTEVGTQPLARRPASGNGAGPQPSARPPLARPVAVPPPSARRPAGPAPEPKPLEKPPEAPTRRSSNGDPPATPPGADAGARQARDRQSPVDAAPPAGPAPPDREAAASGFRPTGALIAGLRERGGFSVAEFADLLQVSAATVRRWEAAPGPLGLHARSQEALAALRLVIENQEE